MNKEMKEHVMRHKVHVMTEILKKDEGLTEGAVKELAKVINAGYDALELFADESKSGLNLTENLGPRTGLVENASSIILTREQIKLLAEFTGDEHPDSFVICYGTIPSHDSACCPDYHGLIAYSENPDESLVVALDNAKPAKHADHKLAPED